MKKIFDFGDAMEAANEYFEEMEKEKDEKIAEVENEKTDIESERDEALDRISELEINLEESGL